MSSKITGAIATFALLRFLSVVAVAGAAVSPAATTAAATSAIPAFSLSDLRRLGSADSGDDGYDDDDNRRDEFLETLSTTGLLAVRLDDNDDNHDDDYSSYDRDRGIALDGLCACVDHPDFLALDQTSELRMMSNGATKRASVGTATVGLNNPLPLPDGLARACGEDVVSAMEALRDAAASVSKEFAAALDGSLSLTSSSSSSGGGNNNNNVEDNSRVILRDDVRGKSYRSVTEIVGDANHLEHFHAYTLQEEQQQQSSSSDDVAWDWHTDAGLFLVFVPAWDCNQDNGNDNDNNADDSFYYRDGRDGTPIRAEFDGGRTAIVMLGQGAEEWLNLPKRTQHHTSRPTPPLKATTHSVRWTAKDKARSSSSPFSEQRQQQQQQQRRRAWYGMMNLVPETAMIYGGKTLGDAKRTLSLNQQTKNGFQPPASSSNSVSLGCGDAPPSSRQHHEGGYGSGENQEETVPTASIGRRSRRRLQMQDPAGCNNSTNFFCWMTCMEIPDADEAELYVEAGYSLYCVDEPVMSSSGGDVEKAHEQCVGRHNKACVGSWQKTVDGVPAAEIKVGSNATSSAAAEPFCYGGTTMYMEGFQLVHSSTCVIMLFPSWVLNSAWKYVLAAIGTFLLAVGLEKFIQQRRKTMEALESGRKRLLVSAALYGVQLTIGYMLMLIIMIYSGVLFLAVVSGLVAGHVFFNAMDAVWPAYGPSSRNSIDDDESIVELADDTSGGCCNEKKKEDARDCDDPNCCDSVNEGHNGPRTKLCHSEDCSNRCSFDIECHRSYGSLDDVPPGASAKTKAEPENTNGNTNKTKAKNRSDRRGVPEGLTPCCQHGT